VAEFLRKELPESAGSPSPTSAPPQLSAPLFSSAWEKTALLPLAEITTVGPWALKRVHNAGHLDQVLETHAPGACLSMEFFGRGLALIFDFGKKSADFHYRLDGGEWVRTPREKPSWMGDRGMFGVFVVSDQLPPGNHAFEMEVVHGDRAECTGTECRLSLVGVIS
jgi:hypothetical protein